MMDLKIDNHLHPRLALLLGKVSRCLRRLVFGELYWQDRLFKWTIYSLTIAAIWVKLSSVGWTRKDSRPFSRISGFQERSPLKDESLLPRSWECPLSFVKRSRDMQRKLNKGGGLIRKTRATHPWLLSWLAHSRRQQLSCSVHFFKHCTIREI